SAVALFLLAYVAAAALGTHSAAMLAHGIFVPRFSGQPGYVMAVIAVFGSLLTPDVVVWQTSTKRESKTLHDIEAQVGCVVACLVSLSVIVAASRMQIA